MHTIQLKRRVIDLKLEHLTDDSAILSGDPAVIAKYDRIEKRGTSTQRQILSLKNQIKMLEVALQQAREEAFQMGFEEGKDAGRRETEARFATKLKNFTNLTETLSKGFEKALSELDRPLLDLAFKIAEKILGNTLHVDEQANHLLIARMHGILDSLVEQTKVIIYLNPDQYDWIANGGSRSEDQFFNNHVTFKYDVKLKPGECLVESDNFVIDGTIDKQLEDLRTQMLVESKN
jgi:flagellar assembly protein FliH